MARSTAKVDASQVDGFARKLALAAQLIEEEGDQFEDLWGEEWADGMRAGVAVDTGLTRDAIVQVEPGVITFGNRGHIAGFLERGTARMSPRPFIRPAMKQIRTPARKDAGERAVKLIQRGR